MIVLSTDKAVYPINAMEISKEHANWDSGTIFWGIRYGNVMESLGSVIPLFTSQILAGEPLTIRTVF